MMKLKKILKVIDRSQEVVVYKGDALSREYPPMVPSQALCEIPDRYLSRKVTSVFTQPHEDVVKITLQEKGEE